MRTKENRGDLVMLRLRCLAPWGIAVLARSLARSLAVDRARAGRTIPLKFVGYGGQFHANWNTSGVATGSYAIQVAFAGIVADVLARTIDLESGGGRVARRPVTGSPSWGQLQRDRSAAAAGGP